ncbi:replication initiation protein [Desulfohalobiaceae bacterium Ax17]|uniref:replication initiation protein n=1 Tax=Desulfovulcanus ferrireducens TaxID=2831190 RepID=UPI00207BC5FD|nr:replication initiation protein [Desulfovulcanus ferrireducens]MBT8763085.1 replication initiation protein [Desulfovulcanus ferrireducens]
MFNNTTGIDRNNKAKKAEKQQQEWMQYPTILTRINPFLITSNRIKEKKDFVNELILENSWGRITKIGPVLTQKDEDILIAILCYAKQYKDKDITGSLAYIGNIIDIARVLTKSKRPGKDTYSSIHKSLIKLASTVINLEVKSNNRFKCILSNNIILHIDYNDKTKKIKIIFNPKFYRLYIKKEYTQLHIKTRLQSLKSPVEKKIYQFIMSHRSKTWRGAREKLEKVLNLNPDRPTNQRRRTIREAINALIARNLLSQNSGLLSADIVVLERCEE